jgi:ribosomal protein S18 acetylase RimI-like enzyme
MTNENSTTEIQAASTDNEIDRVRDFFNSDPIRKELHTYTYRNVLELAVERDDRRLYYQENEQKEIISAAMVWCESRVLADYEGQIRLIATHPDYRRQGFATQLTDRAIAFASERHKAHMKIDVAANESAVDFWRDQGFRDEEYWETENGREMITMEQTIVQAIDFEN